MQEEAAKRDAATAPADRCGQAPHVRARARAEHRCRDIPYDLPHRAIEEDQRGGRDVVRHERLEERRHEEGERERVQEHQEPAFARVGVRVVSEEDGEKDVVVLEVEPPVSPPPIRREADLRAQGEAEKDWMR